MNKRYLLHSVGIFLLALVLLALPLHLRFSDGNTTLPGTTPYYHADMSFELLSSDLALTSPYHYVLGFFYLAFGTLTFTITPLLFSLTSVLLFGILLFRLGAPRSAILWILLAYILSPPLSTASFFATPHSFALLLILAGALASLSRFWIIGIALFTFASLTGLAFTLATLFAAFFLFLYTRNRAFLAALATTLAIFLAVTLPPTIPIDSGLAALLSDFGGLFGISIFTLALALVGIGLFWKHKPQHYSAFGSVFLLLIASYFFPSLLLFSNLFLCTLAGFAIDFLASRKWTLPSLRSMTLLVLFCGLLFSSIAHSVSLAAMPPEPALFDALDVPPGVVFSHDSYGFWIESLGHRALATPFASGSSEQAGDMQALFHTTDIELARNLIDKHHITHILITPEMTSGLVWEREGRGLHFLVMNSKTFKRIETGSSYQLWET